MLEKGLTLVLYRKSNKYLVQFLTALWNARWILQPNRLIPRHRHVVLTVVV